VADSLADYLRRHPEMEVRLSKNGKRIFHTTGDTDDFDGHATAFFGNRVSSVHVDIAP
jgi:glutamate racemase